MRKSIFLWFFSIRSERAANLIWYIVFVISKLLKLYIRAKKDIFGALPVVWRTCILQNTDSKSILAVILKVQPTFCDQRFARYGFWAILVLLSPISDKKWVSSTFNHDVNPENRPSKDSKTACCLAVCKNWTISPLPQLVHKSVYLNLMRNICFYFLTVLELVITNT